MYLGLDLGTSGLRGILVNDEGQVVGDHAVHYPLTSPKPGWSEQNPEDWISACREVLAQLHNHYPKAVAALKGIGVAGHMHGATVLDPSGQVIRPCILWNDGRADLEAAELDAMPAFRHLSGNIVFAGFTAPKLLWLSRHEPENFARIDKVLLPKDYLVYWLTGRLVSDMSDAAGTSWLDVAKRQWSDELITKSKMRPEQLPDLVEGSELVATIDKNTAALLGIAHTVGVVGGGADNAAAACGIGALAEGQGFLSLGTSGVLLAATDQYRPAPDAAVHTFCHAVPQKWYQMGVTLAATDSLNWLASNLGCTAQELAEQMPEQVTGPCPVMFLPYLSGERTPHNDVNARAAFVGMSKATDNTVLCQAVMEGVAFSLRDCLEALKSTGTELPGVFAIGGGTGSEFWLQTLANTLNLPLYLPEKGDFGAAMGAARLAMVGVSNAAAMDVITQPKIQRSYEPQPKLVEHYQAAYQKYSKSYSVLKEIS